MLITTIREKAKKFLQDTLEIKDADEEIRIIGVNKANEDWIVEAEVVERNFALPGHRVFEKKQYVVKLNGELEISSYKQKGTEGKEEE